MKHQDKVKVSISIDPGILQRIDRLADQFSMSRSQVVEHSVLNGLKEGEKLASKLQNPVLAKILSMVMSTTGDETEQELFEQAVIAVRGSKRKVRPA